MAIEPHGTSRTWRTDIQRRHCTRRLCPAARASPLSIESYTIMNIKPLRAASRLAMHAERKRAGEGGGVAACWATSVLR